MIPLAGGRRLQSFLEKRAGILGWSAVLAVIVFFVAPLKTSNPCDFYAFWIVGQTIDKVHIDNAYLPNENRLMCNVAKAEANDAPSKLERVWRRFLTSIDMVGTPTLFAFYKVTATHDFLRDYQRYRIACAFIYVSGFLLFARHMRIPPWALAPLLFFFTVTFWPYRRDVMDTNNSSLLAGSCLLLFTLLGQRSILSHVIAGGVFGFLAAFKPTVSFAPSFIMVALLLEDRRRLLGFGSAFAVMLIASMIAGQAILGPAVSWKNWSAWSAHRSLELRLICGGIPGRFLFLEKTSSMNIFLLVVVFIHAVVVIVFSSRRIVRPPSSHEASPPGFSTICAGSLGLTGYLFSGPLVWAHYFLLTVPAALICLRPRPDVASRRTVIDAAIVCCLLVAFNQTFMKLGWTTMNNYSALTYIGTLGLVAIVLWDWWREGNDDAQGFLAVHVLPRQGRG